MSLLTLSHIETNALLSGKPPVLDFSAMAKAQTTDRQIRVLQSSPSSLLVVEAIPLPNSSDLLYCDTTTGTQCPLVWRRSVFSSLHDLSHPGVRATQKLITARFVWPSISADVRCWARSCVQCQRAKIQRHSTVPLVAFPTPGSRFDVHIDLVGPLPPSRGYTHLLTCVNCFTRGPEAIPLTTTTADAVAQALLSGWIARFGVYSTIITDRGCQFESQLWNTLMTLLGIKRARTTAYRPQTNGMVERFHRQLKSALKAHHNPDSWMDSLPLVVLGICTAIKEDTSCTVSEMYGTTLRLPEEFFTPSPSSSMVDPADYVTKLKAHMQLVRPTSPRLPLPSDYQPSL